MKKYETYKDSGIEWIGQIPEEWKCTKLGWLYANMGSGTTPNSSDYNYYSEQGINWLQTGDLNDGLITSTSKHITNLAIEEKGLKLYPIGSVVIAMYGATIGKVGLLDIETTTNQACCVLPPNEIMNNKYVFYMIQTSKQVLISRSVGGGQPNISQAIIKEHRVPMPPRVEQQAIADYLDYKVGQIDKSIADVDRQIEDLKAYRQSVISEAVTKGLNPDAPMKDSGIEWIGQIPEGWLIVPLKYYLSLKGRIGWKGLKSEEFEENSYAYLVTGQDFTSDIVDWSKCYQINKERYDEDPFIQLENGDLLVTKDGTIGKIAKVKNLDKPACLNSGIFVVKQTKGVFEQNYLYWVLVSNQLKEFVEFNSTGSTIQHLYQNVFENMPLPLPTLADQRAIADYLDVKTEKIDSAIKSLESQREDLNKMRQSIISEAVTGKIDVRDWKIDK